MGGNPHRRATVSDTAETFDFVIIGAGAAGEAALELARQRGHSVAIVDRGLFGGSCAFWACMPSKALLHAAHVHHAGGDFPWQKASDFRDWMINREGTDEPSDASHERRYRETGAEPIRGTARLDGPGVVRVTLADGGERVLHGRHVVIAVGSHSRIPDLVGLDRIAYWDNHQGTGARTLPRSLLVMGGGPTGVELAQVYARYGVPVTLADSNPRILARDHARNAELIRSALERDGVSVRCGVRAVRVEAGAGDDGAHRVHLSDGSTADGHEILVSIGRAVPYEDLGLETIGVVPDGRFPRPDEHLRIAPDVYVAGDPAGPELHTHVAHYQGEMVVRIATGEDVRPDYRAIPRALYTEPEAASVGLLLEQALEQGYDAFEATADLGTTARGYTAQAEGHVTIVVDRARRTLLGVFVGGPGASEVIHEAVLAVKLQVPLAQLADTIHAFPTAARVMGNLFVQVHRELEGVARPTGAPH
jgi:pyruvate/2-oxoglutarate dehydrogenase complex dihydrolipoamide dehydrogenase (E3) component